jgi:MipA family protein
MTLQQAYTRYTLITITAALPICAAAQGAEMGPSPPMRANFEGLIGLRVNSSPEYLGSDQQKTRAAPLLSARWHNGLFAGFPSGIGINFAPEQPLQYGLAVRADMGRDESDSDYLRGMGNIKTRPELAGFANFTLNDVTVRTSLAYGSTDERKGLVWDFGMAYGIPLTRNSRLSFSVDGSFVNEEYMRAYFGVTSAQSFKSGYSIYSPGAGLRDVRLGVNYMYMFSREISLMAGLRAYQLLGDAKDSPLVRSTNGVSGQLGVAYRF